METTLSGLELEETCAEITVEAAIANFLAFFGLNKFESQACHS